MATVSEQRRQLRKRVFKAAQIVVTESAPILECRARDLSDYGARLCFSATYGLPQQFDIIIDGERRAVRSVWRTCTEMGVMFADESRKPADFLERERDVASLLEMRPEACRRIGFPKREFPAAVIKRWQRKMGWPN